MTRKLRVVILGLVLMSAAAAAAASQVYRLHVAGLACPFCAYGIEKQLSTVEGVKDLETDIQRGTVTITMAEGASLDEATARRAVEAAGFTLGDFERVQAAGQAQRAE